MKKVIVIIGMGLLSVAAIVTASIPNVNNQILQNGTYAEYVESGEKTTNHSTNATLTQPDAFEDYGINLYSTGETPYASTSTALVQPDAFEDYNIDLFASAPSSVSSTLTQPDAFEDYGIDLNEKFDFQDNSLLSIKKVKALFQWLTRVANFKFQIFGSRTSPLEVYAKTKEAVHYTTYIMETMGQLVFTEQDESTEERAPQFLKLFFNFV